MRVFEEEKQLAKQINSFLAARSPISQAINFVRQNTYQCVVFGGALRDIVHPDPITPSVRDVDIVVSRSDIKHLRTDWPQYFEGRNRFGGLRLRISRVPIDVWAVEDTWAFREEFVVPHWYSYLTQTTFLNIDGIIADLSPQRGSGIKVFAKHFLHAFRQRILDITLEQNPYPFLATIKALRAMYRYDLRIGYPLAVFLHGVLSSHQFKRLESEQAKHYGHVFFDCEYLQSFHRRLERHLVDESSSKSAFSPQQQLRLW